MKKNWSSVVFMAMCAGAASTGFAGLLPYAYVEARGTNAVNTLYHPGSATKYVADFEFTKVEPVQQRLFGTGGWNNTDLCVSLYINGGKKYAWAFQDGKGNWTDTGLGVGANSRRAFVLDSFGAKATLYGHGRNDVAPDGRGMRSYEAAVSTARSARSSVPTFLFADVISMDPLAFEHHPEEETPRSSFAHAKAYSFEICENGMTVHFFAPFTDPETGAACMKDVVTGQLHGDFIATDKPLLYGDGIGRADDYKYEAGKLSCKFYASADDPAKGKVSIDGGEPAADGSAWLARGGTLRIKAVPEAGRRFVKWNGDTRLIKSREGLEAIVASDVSGQLEAVFEDEDEGVTIAPGTFGGQNIVRNGDFEAGSISSSVNDGAWGYVPSVDVGAWESVGSQGLTKSDAPWYNGTVGGTYAAFLQMDSSIRQTVNAPVSGKYRLSFRHAARNTNISYLGSRIVPMIDGKALGIGYVTCWSTILEHAAFDVWLEAGPHELEFRNDPTGAGDRSSIIDDVSLEIPADPERSLATLDDYGFRFNFTGGTKVVTGKRYTEDSKTAMKFTAADGPGGLSTSCFLASGWGSVANGDVSLNGDWTAAMSVRPGSVNKGIMLCLGGRANNMKQVLFCSSGTAGQLHVAICQKWWTSSKSNGVNIPKSINVGGLNETTSRFHSLVAVHRRENRYITIYYDGILVDRFDSSASSAGRTFKTGLQFGAAHGGAVNDEYTNQIGAGADVRFQDVRYYERALSDEEVAMYARAFPARRASQDVQATDVNPAADATYDHDVTADGVLFVPEGVTVTMPSIAGTYYNYGTIVLTGGGTVTAAPKGPGVMRFTGTQTLNFSAFGNSPVEIDGNVTLGANKPANYTGAPVSFLGGNITLNGQVTIGDNVDSDWYDRPGAVVNFAGGTFAGEGFFYIGGRKTQNVLNVTAGVFTARWAAWGAVATQPETRIVNVGGTGTFAPSSLVYNGGSDPGDWTRLTVRAGEGGTFTPPDPMPPYVAVEAMPGEPVIALARDVALGGPFSVSKRSTLKVTGAKTLDVSGAKTVAVDGSVEIGESSALVAPAFVRAGGTVTVANGAKLVIDLDGYAGADAVFTADGGISLPEGATAAECIELKNAEVEGLRPALSANGTAVVLEMDDLAAPVTAEWTGGGPPLALDDPANWECRNIRGAVLPGAVPTAVTTVRVTGTTSFSLTAEAAPTAAWRRLEIGACSLSADCDWRGVAGFDDGAVIDLNGHKLTVAGLSGKATITDTLGGGELHLDVGAATVENTEVAITGAVKLVKEGEGVFIPKISQTYVGGTVVAAGRLALGTASNPLGPKNAAVTVESGAEYDMNGCFSTSTCIYSYELAGTFFASTTSGPNGYDDSYKFLGRSVVLTGDARMVLDKVYFGCPDQNPMWLTMNGHTLTLSNDVAGGYVGMGAIRARDWGRLVFEGIGQWEWLAGCGPYTVDVTTHSKFKMKGNFDFRGFEYLADVWERNTGTSSAEVLVYGAYKAGDFRPPLVLKNGATLDLGDRKTTFSVDGVAANGTSGEVGLVRFDANATITVDVGRRRGGDQRVVSWTNDPGGTVTFVLDAASAAAGRKLVRREDGLYLFGGFAILVR